RHHPDLTSFPTRRSSDLKLPAAWAAPASAAPSVRPSAARRSAGRRGNAERVRRVISLSLRAQQVERLRGLLPWGCSPAPPEQAADRKSTRLNSSHVAISY